MTNAKSNGLGMPSPRELADFNKGVDRAKTEYERHPVTGYNTAGRSVTAQGRKEAPTYEDLQLWVKDLREQLREVTAERNQARYELRLLRDGGKPAIKRGQW